MTMIEYIHHVRVSSQMKYILLFARLLIGALFVYASVHKIWAPLDFAVSIRNYNILPPSWSNMVALTLPWIELGAGVFLILGIQTKPSALITTWMLGVFLVALIYVYYIGLDIDCGCFSSAASSTGRVGINHFVRDGLLFSVSLFILLMDRGDFSVSGSGVSMPLEPAGP
ncbi:MAG: DoxX family membrane protein [Deltaproteobacteria bacterium]|nr:DoxX family membrane protein [Deltaproteobacteria bacterium]